MFFFLSSSALSRTPVILVPGTMGSVLRGDVSGRKKFWYCPSDLKDSDIWISERYIVPPMVNCLGDWLTMKYDPVTKTAVDQDNVSLHTIDFGGLKGMTFLDDLFKGVHIIPYFKKYISYLQERGYVEGQDLFGAPFDWRRGLVLGDKYWQDVKELVEKAYTLNEQSKVSLVGHSLGGYFVHYFLSNVTTAEWRNKYIESAILVAPSFGGAGTVVEQLWNGKVSFLRNLGLNDEVEAKLSSSVGALYVHLPNVNVFGENTVFIDEDGKEFKARDVEGILRNNGKFRETPEIYELNKEFSHQKIEALDVPTVIVYNDALKTTMGYNLQKKEKLRSKGDSVVNAEGFHHACNDWKPTKKLLCYNLNSTSEWAAHIPMVLKSEYVDLVLKHVVDTTWEN